MRIDPAMLRGWLLACLAASLLALVAAQPALGRTITLDAGACDAMAMISADAPRLSWAGYEPVPGTFSPMQLDLNPTRSLLMRYNLEAIPQGMRIVHAEWIIPVEAVLPGEARVYVWRMSVEWAAGVCHEHRMIRDGAAVPWASPGGKGSGADRGAAGRHRPGGGVGRGSQGPQEPVPLPQPVAEGELKVNVTEEVSLWHSGAVPNYGWMISVEDSGSIVRMPSPIGRARDTWRLRITYEPQ